MAERMKMVDFLGTLQAAAPSTWLSMPTSPIEGSIQSSVVALQVVCIMETRNPICKQAELEMDRAASQLASCGLTEVRFVSVIEERIDALDLADLASQAPWLKAATCLPAIFFLVDRKALFIDRPGVSTDYAVQVPMTAEDLCDTSRFILQQLEDGDTLDSITVDLV